MSGPQNVTAAVYCIWSKSPVPSPATHHGQRALVPHIAQNNDYCTPYRIRSTAPQTPTDAHSGLVEAQPALTNLTSSAVVSWEREFERGLRSSLSARDSSPEDSSGSPETNETRKKTLQRETIAHPRAKDSQFLSYRREA